MMWMSDLLQHSGRGTTMSYAQWTHLPQFSFETLKSREEVVDL